MNTLYVATSNYGKFNELRSIASKYNVNIEMLNVPKFEIQHDELEAIASYAALTAALIARRPLIVEDSGLFIESLNGFPGALSSYVYKKIGITGVLKVLEGVSNRRAYFKSVVAYASLDYNVKLFTGVVYGRISERARGTKGFGFDPIFIPDGDDRTFAEMELEDKNKLSHRGVAFRKFLEWFINNF